MTEQDDFRERIKNWVVVVREPMHFGESNLAPVLRALRIRQGLMVEEHHYAYRVKRDEEDAELLDKAYKRLLTPDRLLIRDYWLRGYSVGKTARRNGLFYRTALERLNLAEKHFHECVRSIETALDKIASMSE